MMEMFWSRMEAAMAAARRQHWWVVFVFGMRREISLGLIVLLGGFLVYRGWSNQIQLGLGRTVL